MPKKKALYANALLTCFSRGVNVAKGNASKIVDLREDFYECECGGWTENCSALSNDETRHFLAKIQNQLIAEAPDMFIYIYIYIYIHTYT